jgi:2-desacetyl-2-hydroxyethyl bacteriochlorophyllide A dehydrogenase
MRAAVMTQFNQPWEIKTLPDPKPGDGQVLIRIEASGMCYTDIHVHHGHLPLKPPVVLGHEPVGKIVETGPGVTDFKVGDRVGVSWMQKGCGRCRFCREKREKYCPEQVTWMQVGGGNSELMLAYASGCTLVPEGLPSDAAAPIFCAGFTVFSGLRNADPRPGERVAVLGLGGLGHLALQYAKALGLATIAVTSTEGKRKDLLALGADEVVVTGQDAGKALRDAGGADVILATSNSAAPTAQIVKGLRPEGRLVLMGLPDGPVPISVMDILLSQCRVIGSTQNRRRDLVEALDLAAAGKVKPVLEHYPIDRVNEVRDRLAAGKVRYRAVLSHGN